MTEYEKQLDNMMRKKPTPTPAPTPVGFTRKPATEETLEEWGKVSC